jgi:hypothetical protein
VPTPPEQRSVHDRALDDIGGLALGEQVEPVIADHIRDCLLCQHELTVYRELVSELRAGANVEEQADAEPPAALWDRIATEVGAGTPESSAASTPPPVQQAHASHAAAPARRRWQRPLLAAAAAVAVFVAGLGGWAIGRSGPDSSPPRAAQAALAAQPGTSTAVHGTATIHPSNEGFTMVVNTRRLPAPNGYYEVWLYNPSANRMVAVGTLGTAGRGSFTVPQGIDLAAYHIVDVSAQRFDGNPAHQRSVLRGPLS